MAASRLSALDALSRLVQGLSGASIGSNFAGESDSVDGDSANHIGRQGNSHADALEVHY
jgi:hypothetical protein